MINPATDSMSFTVDTSYDGGDDPSLSWEDDVDVDDGIVEMDDDEVDLTVEVDSDDNDDVDENADRIACYDGDTDDEEIDSETPDEDTDDEVMRATCNFDIDDDYLDDNEVELTVEMCDAAGNCDSSDEGDYEFDVNSPSLTEPETEVSNVASEFDVEVSATDDVGIEELEYWFNDEELTFSDRNTADFSSGDDSFTVEVSDLESGDHTLYIEAVDEVGRRSTTKSIDFSYYPDADPETSLEVPSNLSVTAGESTEFDVTVENTGKLLVPSVDVQVSSDVYSETKESWELAPGDSATLTFEISGAEEDIGEYELEVSTNSSSESFTLVVEANQKQRESLDSRLSDYEGKLEGLESNVTSLQQKVNGEKQERLENNFTAFKDKVEEAKEAKEEGKYYKVESALEGIDSDYSSASESYDKVKEEYQNSRRNMFIMAGAGLLILAVLGVVGFISYSEEYEISVEKLEELGVDVDLDLGGIELMDRIESLGGTSEKEAEKFEWDGFKD